MTVKKKCEEGRRAVNWSFGWSICSRPIKLIGRRHPQAALPNADVH